MIPVVVWDSDLTCGLQSAKFTALVLFLIADGTKVRLREITRIIIRKINLQKNILLGLSLLKDSDSLSDPDLDA